ncbi:MAG TPA: 16S rRNA (cytosine(1402)-N(4))-methyltransferase RsmH [Verrucomicrobiae bacterium]|nr:16S rRNA (cytosine(1402)-N(4))-methyltransferase RsmH [Verrucomicrobiae bacterium]
MERSSEWRHRPVMLGEVLEALQPAPGKLYFDGTVGMGGHSEAILERGGWVMGWDRDPAALAKAQARLSRFGDAFCAQRGNFGDLSEYAPASFEGVLLDLGVGSHQLDEPGRGFSFRFDAPLDMRFDPSCGKSAADLVRGATEEEMVRLLREYGEEPRAKRIARAIVSWRRRADELTTLGLAAVVEEACGGRRGARIHPATRTFQALRIAVNDELGALRRALGASARVLKPGGRLAVITFHSLEDRIVKGFMREASREFEDTPEWPNSVPNPLRTFVAVNRRAIVPSPEECDENPRARSAKLRVVERLGGAP